MWNKILYLSFILTVCLILSGCNSDLSNDLESYEADMETIHTLDQTVRDDIDSLDLETLQESMNDMDNDLEADDLDERIELLEDDILPNTEKIKTDIENIEVSNEELEPVFTVFEESTEVTLEFVTLLHEYLTAYQNSLASNAQLIDLSQSFMSNQEERTEVIENTEGEREAVEIDDLISQLNENSSELETEAQLLQGYESLEVKRDHIDDVLLPLIDSHISALNEKLLETQDAVRVRSITLDMYYGFKQYYEERKNTILYNNILQETQLQNILPLKETYEKLNQEYYEGLEDLKSGE